MAYEFEGLLYIEEAPYILEHKWGLLFFGDSLYSIFSNQPRNKDYQDALTLHSSQGSVPLQLQLLL